MRLTEHLLYTVGLPAPTTDKDIIGNAAIDVLRQTKRSDGRNYCDLYKAGWRYDVADKPARRTNSQYGRQR